MSIHDVSIAYAEDVPRLWNETIEAHRRDVRHAILESAAALIAEQGLRAVTMSQIAEKAGIGRATLYKYFADVESIVLAWHEQQIAAHLRQLAHIRDQAGDARERLEAVLLAYGAIVREARGRYDAAHLHRDQHVVHAERHLHGMIRDLLVEGAEAGALRDDISPDELATYCLHALDAARDLPSKDAVGRLVTVILAGLNPTI